jgi:AraC family transcriptional regulator
LELLSPSAHRRVEIKIELLARLTLKEVGPGQLSARCRRHRAIALSLNASCSAGGSRVTCRSEPFDPREPLVDPSAWRGGVRSASIQLTTVSAMSSLERSTSVDGSSGPGSEGQPATADRAASECSLSFLLLLLRRSDMVTRVMHLLESAHTAALQDGSYAERCISDALTLLRAACDLTAARSLGPIAGTPAPSQIMRMLKIMDANIANHVRIKDIAAAAGLSRSAFSRAFLRSVGESPRGYLRRQRIKLAQHLMLSTRKSLAEIALDCGLSDQSHLTKSFRRVVGISPNAWRRSRRGWCSR